MIHWQSVSLGLLLGAMSFSFIWAWYYYRLEKGFMEIIRWHEETLTRYRNILWEAGKESCGSCRDKQAG